MSNYNGDCIVFENPNLRNDWRRDDHRLKPLASPETIPSGVAKWLPTTEPLDEVRKVKDLTCIDLVICTLKARKTPAVLFSLRKKTGSFGGKWWMYGASLGAYQGIASAIADVAQKESGVQAGPQAFVGVYRTCAPDKIQSTTNLCYVAYVPYAKVKEQMRADTDHEAPRLFSLPELVRLPVAERHWYPLQVASRALEHMPSQN